MIRAGRTKFVLTVKDMASLAGVPLRKYRETKPYLEDGHPEPISHPDSARPLWDREQVEAYYAGKPVPPLPPASDQDLLDRHEAAALVGVTARSWNLYKHDPQLTKHLVKVPEVGGYEHWPRHVVQQYKDARPGHKAAGGRPRGSGDLIPRDQIPARVAELLDANPAVTINEAANTLGIAAFPTARDHLNQLRGERIADLIEADPDLDPADAAEQLGYPRITHRGATAVAEAELQIRRARVYLDEVADALAKAGLVDEGEIEDRGALRERAQERLLFGIRERRDAVPVRLEHRVGRLHRVARGGEQLREARRVDAEQTHRPHRAAHQTTQNVAAAVIGRLHPVGEQHE